ncbi:ASCH domain-containing protein [Paenibacillus sp. FA6]|uniref:ASCH domain-containing protein n=1 Tax=Paenibacillus sp. FA6 TaxID=3413029 RepID=UPI003F6607E5
MKKLVFWGKDENDDRLLNEVISEVKTVTCTPKIWYYDDPEEEPTNVGDLVAVFDRRGNYKCTIEITENYEIPYGLVDDRIAQGENYTSIQEFYKDHNNCWEQSMLNEGLCLTDETIIVVEHFKIISIVESKS